MELVFNTLIYTTWFLATFYTVYFLLTLFYFRKKIFETKNFINKNEKVTFLIPAYNEENGIKSTIDSLKKLTYRNVEFIILNDGSNDNTNHIINKLIRKDGRFIFVDNKINKGKAGVLNEGIKIATGKYIACLDADSTIDKNILEKTLPYFEDKDTGAVTVTVNVKNPKNIIQKTIAVEFNLGLSLFLKIFSFLGIIFVTPGPFSIYRKSMLDEIGGYDENNVTEDHEIAFRIYKANYKIKNSINANVYTTIPETFKDTYIQRRRWYAGSLQTLFKHKDILFNKKYKLFGYYMPYHYSLIALGLITFISSIFLLIKKYIDYFTYYSYTNFNFFDHLKWSSDLLTYGRINIIGFSMVLTTVGILFIGLHSINKKITKQKTGTIGYFFLFIFYQIFWIGAIWTVIKNKKIKWR